LFGREGRPWQVKQEVTGRCRPGNFLTWGGMLVFRKTQQREALAGRWRFGVLVARDLVSAFV
jgi:hypothetical protein